MRKLVWVGIISVIWITVALRGAERTVTELKQPQMPFGFMPLSEKEQAFHLWTTQTLFTFDRSGLSWRTSVNQAMRQTFVGAAKDVTPRGLEPMKTKVNRYQNRNPGSWQQGMAMYRRLIYRDIYPGIDVVYQGAGGQLKRDLVVHPGADPNQIRIAFEGIEGMHLQAGGKLIIGTADGQLEEGQPYVYQEIGGARHRVSGHFMLHDNQQLGFVIGTYDPTVPLVIDPIISGGSYGGSDSDAILAGYATDTAYYFTGQTTSSDLPLMNPAQGVLAGGTPDVGDAFLACFDKSTLQLTYATYFGGSGSDQANGVYVDQSGNATIAGWTDSPDLAVLNAVQSTLGGLTDGFLAQFNASGALVWATYHGGSGDDQIADLDGNTVFQYLNVVGFTTSTNFPLMNADDATCGCSQGAADAFFGRYRFDGSLNTSTYLGGNTATSTFAEEGAGTALANDVALDVFALGETAYVTGWTQSTDFPKQPFSGDHAGGRDAFYVLYGFDGRRDYSILLGGSGDDVGDGIAAFNQSEVVITGSTTSSTDFPVTANAQQMSYGGGASDAFIARINGSNSPTRRMVTYWGGSGADAGREVYFGRDSALFQSRYIFAGVTDSADFPLDGAGANSAADGLDSFLMVGEPLGNNDLDIFTGELLGGPGTDGIFSLSGDKTTGPFAVLAAGTTSDAGGLPRAGAPLVSPDASRRGLTSDDGFFNLFCIGPCVGPAKPDLKVTMTLETNDGDPATVVETGKAYRYRILIENIGQADAPANASILITIPHAVTLLTTGVTGPCTETQNPDEAIVDCTINSILPFRPGDSRTVLVSFVALTPEAAVITNRIRASALALPQAGDLDPTDNVAFADRIIQAELLGGAGSNVTQGNSEDEGDPISMSNGAFHFEKPLLNLGGPMPLSASLVYRSDLPSLVDNIHPRRFWIRPFAALIPELAINGEMYTSAQLPNGDIISFVKQAGDWALVQGDVDLGFGLATGNTVSTPYQLIQDGAWFYVVDPRFGKIYLFEKVMGLGLIRAIMDRNSNTHRYIYANGDGQPPTRIEDGLGRSLDFEYLSIAGSLKMFLSKITDQGGRQIQFTYEAVGADNAGMVTLRSIADAMGQTTTFAYAGPDLPGHRITRVIRPNGQANQQQTYDFQELNGFQEQRVTTQVQVAAPKTADAGAPNASLAYDPQTNQVQYTNELGHIWEYQSTDHHGHNTAITDPNLNQIQLGYDVDGFLDQVTDRDQRTTGIQIHKESGLPMAITDAAGGILDLAFTAKAQTFTNPVSMGTFTATFYDVTRIDLPDGTHAQRLVDDRGNQTQLLWPTGDSYLATHNQQGQVLTVENPSGGTRTYSYDGNGNLAASSDSDTGTVVYDYDTLFRNTKITVPSGEEAILVWNLNNRLTQFADLRGNTYTFAYDVLDNPTSMTGPDGGITSFRYNDFDILSGILDPLNRRRELGLNVGNQITSFDDGSGDLVQFTYDDAGFRDSVRRQGLGFDEVREGEGDLLEIISSDGSNTAILNREARGLVDQITTPEGRHFQFDYDHAQRMVRKTQPSGRRTDFDYNDLGHITRLTYPGGVETVISRNGLGLGTQYLDGEGHTWNFTYSPMGREETRSDPLGRQTVFEYDVSGRVSRTFLPETTVDFTYDGALITAVDFSASGPRQGKAPMSLNFGYDARGNLTAAQGVDLTYDLADQLTGWTRGGVSFSQTFDAAGRLETLIYPGGAMVVTYEYNQQGNLLRVSDDLTGTQIELSYDALGRVTGMARTNQVDTRMQYRPDGFLVGLQDAKAGQPPFIDLQYRFDVDGNQIGETAIAPVLPEANIALTTRLSSFDAASQISNSGYLYDEQGRLIQDPRHGTWTWDMASRLIGYGTTTLAYDGLGHIKQVSAGPVIDLHTHPTMGSSHVLLEQDTAAGGPATRWRFYVFTPAGKLLYGVDRLANDAPFFYHFNRQGSTLALTDAQGDVLQAYAYTPFGQRVVNTAMRGGPGFDQPYQHAGRDGVFGLPGGIDLMGSRPFNADTGTFATGMVDFEMVDRGTADPGELGPYNYAWNRPLDVTQPDGSHWGQPDFGTTADIIVDPFGAPIEDARIAGIDFPGAVSTVPLIENDLIDLNRDVPNVVEPNVLNDGVHVPDRKGSFPGQSSSIFISFGMGQPLLEVQINPDEFGEIEGFSQGIRPSKMSPRTTAQITERLLTRHDPHGSPMGLTIDQELDFAWVQLRVLVSVFGVARILGRF